MVKSIEKVKYMIVGNSAGGIGAAEAIRELDKDGSIIWNVKVKLGRSAHSPGQAPAGI